MKLVLHAQGRGGRLVTAAEGGRGLQSSESQLHRPTLQVTASAACGPGPLPSWAFCLGDCKFRETSFLSQGPRCLLRGPS